MIGVGRQERHQLKVRTVKEELPMEIKKQKVFEKRWSGQAAWPG